MGYTTNFRGVLKFDQELVASQLAHLNTILGEDCRDHPEWEVADRIYYIDLQLTDDFSGLEWNGAEKTYKMDKLVNVVIRLMRDKWPNFSLTGSLSARGEDFDDIWQLVIDDDGYAIRVETPLVGDVITCPHCEQKFLVDDK